MPTLDDAENALLITITTPLYTLSKDNDGFDIIQIDEYSLSGAPGDPALPIRVFSIALPPDVSLESVIVKVVDFKLETLDGSFKIKQAVADQTSGDDSSSGKEEITGEDIIQQLPPGQMRKWQFTKVEYSPFHYDDETGTLSVVSEVQLKISYDLSSAELDEALLADTAMDDIAEETFLNFDAAKDWYKLEE